MKALIIGATGATGKDLVRQLLNDDAFEKTDIFVRRPVDLAHQKLSVHIVDFEKPESWKHLVKGDVAFSCLGTTLKDAGSKAAQWKVDHDYQYAFAQSAKANGVRHYVLISSGGANANSRMFYLKMKGQLEEKIYALGFDTTIILQPGLLERKNSDRVGERIGLSLLGFFNRMGMLKSQMPVSTDIVAKAMINSVKTYKGETRVLKTKDIYGLAKQ